MKISYNYLPLMQEIKEEIEDGVLSLDDVIQIVRADYDILGYRPIIDWYYGKKEMENMKMFMSPEEKERYLQDFEKLEGISVKNCIAEMYAVNKLIQSGITALFFYKLEENPQWAIPVPQCAWGIQRCCF